MMTSSRLSDNFLQSLLADGLIRPQERVLVALSGGSDSVALLHLLRAQIPTLHLSLFAAHLDHAIRPQSRDDAAFVRRLCSELEVPLTSLRVDVPALAQKNKVGLEEAGRLERQSFLEEEAGRRGCTSIALGHHRGDQAETLLHHLGRGCSLHGLAAMRPRRGLLVRPLLAYSKAELLAYLDEIKGEFVQDLSNDDLVYTRNRIRHQLLPLLATLNPRIEATLGNLAATAGAEDDYWREECQRLEELLVIRDADGIHLQIPALCALHPAARFRLFHYLLTPLARARKTEVGSLHLVALDRLLTAAAPQGEIHLPGVRARRRYDRLSLAAPAFSPLLPWSLTIAGPGRYRLPGGELRVAIVPDLPATGREGLFFDAASLPFPLIVRTLRPGDRMRLPGMTGHKRVKELLMERKVVREERPGICVLEKDEILGVIGLRRSGLFLPRSGNAVLQIIYTPHNSAENPEMP